MLEESLRNAIEQDDFVLVYQPQIELATGRLRGFEALLRWEHRVAGTISPGVFIPLLEETRLINRLGEWIFDQGVRQCQAWRERFGEQLLLSLNVSPVQFGMPQLVAMLNGFGGLAAAVALRRNGIDDLVIIEADDGYILRHAHIMVLQCPDGIDRHLIISGEDSVWQLRTFQ